LYTASGKFGVLTVTLKMIQLSKNITLCSPVPEVEVEIVLSKGRYVLNGREASYPLTLVKLSATVDHTYFSIQNHTNSSQDLCTVNAIQPGRESNQRQ